MNSFNTQWGQEILSIEEMERQICQKFVQAGIEFAWTLSSMDLMMIANNAYCYEERLALIPPINKPNGENIIITADEHPQVFMHVIMTAYRNGNPALAAQFMSSWRVAIPYSMYLEYIDTIQDCVKHLQDHPEMTQEVGVYIAHRFKQDLDAWHPPAIAPAKPMISLESLQGQSLHVSVRQSPCSFRLQPNSSIVIPWAWLSTVNNLKNFTRFWARRIILNDKKVFTMTVIDTLCKLMGISNVTTHTWSFTEMDNPDKSVGIMILSLIHSAWEEAIWNLLEKAKWWIAQDGLVVTHAASDLGNPGDVTLDQMWQLFARAWFDQMSGTLVSYKMPRRPMLHSQAYNLSRATWTMILWYLNEVSSWFKHPAVTMNDTLMVHRNLKK